MRADIFDYITSAQKNICQVLGYIAIGITCVFCSVT